MQNDTPEVKERVCCLCGRLIKSGSISINRVGVSFGKLQSDYMYQGCEELTHDWDAMDWETFSTGDGEWPKYE